MDAKWHGLILELEPKEHVALSYDLGDGPFPDSLPMLMAWGKPVGDAFGTHAEVWACSATACIRWYPRFSEDLKELQHQLADHFAGGGG